MTITRLLSRAAMLLFALALAAPCAASGLTLRVRPDCTDTSRCFRSIGSTISG